MAVLVFLLKFSMFVINRFFLDYWDVGFINMSISYKEGRNGEGIRSKDKE